MNKNDIARLAAQAKKGDKAAFEKLYKEFYSKVYYFTKQNVNSQDAAEELTAETFSDAMERIGTLRSEESFVGWLYCIAYRKCADYIKSRELDQNHLDRTAEPDLLSQPLMLPDDYAVNEQTKAQLQGMIDSLPEDMRSAVILYYYNGLSVAEVAQAIGTNENNANQKLHRARQRLRKQIEKLTKSGKLFSCVPLSAVLANLDNSGLLSSAGAGTAAAVAAAVVGVPVGLSKLSGGTSRHLLGFTLKYWSRHKKSLAALLFSGVLLCAVVCCIFLNMRQGYIRGIDDEYDKSGAFTLMIPDEYSQAVELFSDKDTVRGELHVIGTAGIGSRQFHIGTIDDPENLAHFPIEQGRLPKAEGELAAYRSALEGLGFFGDVGDKITLDRGTFTLVGILHDEQYEYRESTDNYFSQVYASDVIGNSENEDEERFKYTVPMLYTGGDHSSETLYSWVMLDNIAKIKYPDKNVESIEYFEDGFVYALMENGIEFEEESYQCHNRATEALYSYRYGFKQSVRKMMILYVVSSLIAALSVVAVMRAVFSERENTVTMLRKVGVSKRQIRVMYGIEYIFIAVIQTALGILLGVAAHGGIYLYQTKVMGMKSISGFTTNTYADWLCPNPFIIAVLVSASVLLAGYLIAALLSVVPVRRRSRTKAASLRRCIARVFRTRAVTIIQTAALALICFGSVYGYMIFHNSQGYYNEQTGEFDMMIDTSFGTQSQFDFEEDGAQEYYYAVQAPMLSNDVLTFTLESDVVNGIGDDTADDLGDTIARGSLPWTFIAGKENTKLNNRVSFASPDAEKIVRENSSEEGNAFLKSGKAIYNCPTVLTRQSLIEKLSDYVVSGEIRADKLASGEEVILALRSDNSPLSAGDRITVGYATTVNGLGIDKLFTSDVTIGAVVDLPQEMDKLTRYAALGDDNYNLLTTAQGAAALGFENARYNELIAFEKIGSKLPLGTGLTLKSYEQQRREIFLQNATLYGSMASLVLLMSLLGFAAYFNGIGLKIRLKEYQISIMRAVGTPLSRLRRRLTFDSVRIPVIASAAAFAMVKLLQRIVFSGFNKAQDLLTESGKVYDKMMSVTDETEQNRLEALVNSLQTQSRDTNRKFLTDTQLWYSNPIIPILVIFAVMCIVTIVLTHRSVGGFDSNIAYSISKGRKRR